IWERLPASAFRASERSRARRSRASDRHSVVSTGTGEDGSRQRCLEAWYSQGVRFVDLGGGDQADLGLEAERPTAVGALDQEDGRLPLLDDPVDHDALGILPACGREADQVAQGKRPIHGFSLLEEMVTAMHRSRSPSAQDVTREAALVRPNLEKTPRIVLRNWHGTRIGTSAAGNGLKRQEAEDLLGPFNINSETRRTRDRDQEVSSP